MPEKQWLKRSIVTLHTTVGHQDIGNHERQELFGTRAVNGNNRGYHGAMPWVKQEDHIAAQFLLHERQARGNLPLVFCA
jgi:hypothetical protein